jgi:cell wall-associated NlpC family hydrolase
VKTVVKRALVAPLITAAATLPAVAAHPAAAGAAVTSQSVATGFAVVDHKAAGVAGQEAGTVSAGRTHHHPRHPRRYWAFVWATHQRGAPYCWGGTGGCFDCSGLVMAAYGHVHLYFGRDTFDMLGSGRLVRVSVRHVRKGDLAFFGSGHVELVARRGFTYGALHSGAPVSWHRITRWFHPTMYFHVRGSH